MKHRYTLTEHDFDILESGKELIAECDFIADEKHKCSFTGIRIRKGKPILNKCVRCGKEVRKGQLFVVTGNCRYYHHPKCSPGVPLLRRIGKF